MNKRTIREIIEDQARNSQLLDCHLRNIGIPMPRVDHLAFIGMKQELPPYRKANNDGCRERINPARRSDD